MKKMLTMIVATTMLLGSVGTVEAARVNDTHIEIRSEEQQKDPLSEFVTRLYTICLGRKPDAGGLADWTGQLKRGESTGVKVAFGFIFSKELQSKKLSNADYVEIMYEAFLGRKSDPAGKAEWVSKMDAGMTRQQLFAGFANSQEFDKICYNYGIARGSYDPATGSFGATANRAKIEGFVTRLYQTCLGRKPDATGLSDWTNKLANKQISGAEAAYGFFFSNEYRNKNKSNGDFVTDLYNCFLGRKPDDAGFKTWVGKLDNLCIDLDIFNGFAQSQEFNNICKDYGIERGGKVSRNPVMARADIGKLIPTSTPTPTVEPTPEPTAKPTPKPAGYKEKRAKELGIEAVELPTGQIVYGIYRDDIATDFMTRWNKYREETKVVYGSTGRAWNIYPLDIMSLNEPNTTLEMTGTRLEAAWCTVDFTHHTPKDGTNSKGVCAHSMIITTADYSGEQILEAFKYSKPHNDLLLSVIPDYAPSSRGVASTFKRYEWDPYTEEWGYICGATAATIWFE